MESAVRSHSEAGSRVRFRAVFEEQDARAVSMTNVLSVLLFNTVLRI